MRWSELMPMMTTRGIGKLADLRALEALDCKVLHAGDRGRKRSEQL